MTRKTQSHNLWDAAKAVLRGKVHSANSCKTVRIPTLQGGKQGPECRALSAALALGLREVKGSLQLQCLH